MTRNPHTFIGCDAEYAESGIVIFGAPFDSTTSYRPGARFGCSAIRNESFGIETFSPYQDRDLAYMRIFDGGDLDLPFGSPEAALDAIAAQADEILGDGKIPVMLGGEHLVTLGAVRSAVRRHPDLRIVHFDAHADLRDDYRRRFARLRFGAAMNSWATDASASSAFAAATARSSNGARASRRAAGFSRLRTPCTRSATRPST